LAAGAAAHIERRNVWLPVGLIALAFAVTPLWIRYGGTASGPLPPMPANPLVVLQGGQKIAFAAGDLVAGDGLLCENKGVRVGAWVPKPGRTSRAQFVGSEWTASFRIHTRPDGAVIARCS
jgi:hypothetical protein